MAAEECAKAGYFDAIAVAIHPLAAVEALLLLHECIRILAYFFAHSRVLLQELFQGGVLFRKFLVLQQRRILPHLLCDFGMTIQEAVEGRYRAAPHVRVGSIFPLVEALFLLQERVRMLLELIANPGILLQELLQGLMLLDKSLVIEQRGVLLHLLGDFRMGIEKSVEVPQFSAPGLVILPAVKALFLLHKAVGILAEFLAYSRVLLQILLQRGVFLDEFLVIHQRGILSQLFGCFGMIVEELIEPGDLRAGGIIVTLLRRGLRRRGLR